MTKSTGLIDRLLGRPLANDEEEEQKVGVFAGLPMLGLDGLASAAYGPEAALTVLLPAGAMGIAYVLPITGVLLVLLTVLFFSYRQTISAYPNGGGSYTVARENLGEWAGLLAGGSLMLDYILNVAVAISSGVGALVSAVPALNHHILAICLVILVLLTLVNLRGIREPGTLFALPTYTFVVCLGATLLIGLGKTLLSGGHPVALMAPPAVKAGAAVSIWLLLRSFASGCTAMTGVEAVSNGVTAFREPQVDNARRTLASIIFLLAFFLGGVALLCRAYHIGATDPNGNDYQSVLSMITAAVVGKSWFYYLTLGSVLVVVSLSANTSFADFPRLCRLIALDDYLPHFFSLRGRRLVMHLGILILSSLAAGLLILFGGITDRLIPLFAIGALGAFTLSQAGMVIHWKRNPGKHSHGKALVNGLGAVLTAAALVIVLAAKFSEGAWITLLLIPCVLLLFRFTHHHYSAMSRATAEVGCLDVEDLRSPLALVPIRGWTRMSESGLRMAMKISHEVTAITVSTGEDTEEVEELRRSWSSAVLEPLKATDRPAPELLVLTSPYRDLVGPLIEQVERMRQAHPDRTVVVIVPEVVETRWWHFALHNQRAALLKARLYFHGDRRVVMLNVPWYFDAEHFQ